MKTTLSKSNAVREIKAMPGMTARLRDGEIQVNFRDGKEDTAYYTTDADDAIDTARHMASHR